MSSGCRVLYRSTNYLYNGLNLLEEVDNSGNVLAKYTQDTGIDQPLSEVRSGATSYYEQDALGSVTSLSNGSGALVNTYSYDSFGKLTTSTGTITNPFQYTGREFDFETGLYFYRARYYDSTAGRFESEDPISFRGGTDFYKYAENNPINLIDPLGLFGKPNMGDTQWRQCTRSEVAFCIESCANQGKRYESCAVGQTYRIRKLGRGPAWYDYVGDPSCSCEEPEDPSNQCKELQPDKEPLQDTTPDYTCRLGERFDCVPQPGSHPGTPWIPGVNPLIPGYGGGEQPVTSPGGFREPIFEF